MDLVLLVVAELIGLPELVRNPLYGLLHFADKVLQLLDLLVR